MKRRTEMMRHSEAGSTPFTHRLRVRYGECDPQGVVFNANYLLYLDVALTEFWRQRLGGYAKMIAAGIDVMLVQSNLGFRSPARADDEIAVHLRVMRLGTTSLAFVATVARDDTTLLEADLHYVFVDAQTLKKTEIPAAVRAALAPT